MSQKLSWRLPFKYMTIFGYYNNFLTVSIVQNAFSVVLGEGVVLGHEISGVVAALGTECDVMKSGLSVGDRVMVYPWNGCMECEICLLGQSNMCEHNQGGTTDIGQGKLGGGYGEYVVVPHYRNIFKVPDGIAMDLACLLPCSGTTAYWATRKTVPHVKMAISARGSARVFIMGAGGLGLWGVKAFRLLFDKEKVCITVGDLAQDKLDLAREIGADETVLLNKYDNIDATVSNMTNGGVNRYIAVIDYVGTSETATSGLQSLRKGGVFVNIGLAGGEVVLKLPKLVFNTLSIHGHRVGPPVALKELIELVSSRNVSVPIVHHHRLEEISEIHQQIREGKMTGRAVIKYDWQLGQKFRRKVYRLTLYMINFSEGTKSYIYVLCQSSSLAW